MRHDYAAAAILPRHFDFLLRYACRHILFSSLLFTAFDYSYADEIKRCCFLLLTLRCHYAFFFFERYSFDMISTIHVAICRHMLARRY